MTSYMTNDKFLQNENRKKLMKEIYKIEGKSFSELLEDFPIGNGTLAYHLYMLEKRKYIKSVKDGKYRRFYSRKAKVELFSNLEEKIIDSLKSDPDMHQADLARELEVSAQSISYNIKKLVNKNIIQSKPMGPYNQLILLDENQ